MANKRLPGFLSTIVLILSSMNVGAASVWVVESGDDANSSAKETLILSPGEVLLDLYYDTEGDISYGYDFLILPTNGASVSNFGGGDSGLGNVNGAGWRQLGGDFLGVSGDSIYAFSFIFEAESASNLLLSGSYTDSNFLDSTIDEVVLATVSVTPVPLPSTSLLFLFSLSLFLFRRSKFGDKLKSAR